MVGTLQVDNGNFDTNKINNLKKHDGIPCEFFLQSYKPIFLNGLREKTQDGHTMFAVYEGKDPGGVNWQGPAPNADQQRAHLLRLSRLQAILLTCIDEQTTVYQEISEMNGDGIAAVNYFFQRMHIPMKAATETKLETYWTLMSVENLNLNIEGKMPSVWLKIIMQVAKYFDTPKTINQCWSKFLQGLPAAFSTLASVEMARPDPRFVFPPNYGAPHPLQGQPHPLAGQKDLLKLGAEFSGQCQMFIDKGVLRETKGNKQVDVSFDKVIGGVAEVVEANAADFRRGGFSGTARGDKKPGKPFKKADPRIVCLRCGGLGHMAAYKLQNGQVSYCRTATQIDADILDKITYPHLDGKEVRKRFSKKPSPVSVADEASPEGENEPESGSEDDEKAYGQFLAQVQVEGDTSD